MILAETREQLRQALGPRRPTDRTARGHHGRTSNRLVTLVPTMGALHDGHARLMDEASSGPGQLVVSVFVNPLQFGPSEDLARYPRTLDADLRMCGDHGADVVFAPSVTEVYPFGEPLVGIDPGPVGSILEGVTRPGHFRGVLTVVAKLFGLVGPDVAVFGQKDYQQLVLIRRMVEDLCMDIDIVGAATVREVDGLALSSRNRYLDAEHRSAASSLSRALLAGRAAHDLGADGVLTAADKELAAELLVSVDYLALRTADLAAPAQHGSARLLVAAKVGRTRLIDNLAVDLGPEPSADQGGESMRLTRR